MSSPTPPIEAPRAEGIPPPRVCQNCGTVLTGHYCARCGQHDVEYCRSFRHFTAELLENLFHFEGKFLVSVAWLLAKPGRLTNEFVAGRRQSQLNPVRFYIFATVLFFLGVHLLNHGHLVDFNPRQVDQLAKGFEGRSGEWLVGHKLTEAQKAEVLRRMERIEENGQTLDLAAINTMIQDVQKALPGDPAAAPKAEAKDGQANTRLRMKPSSASGSWAVRLGRALEDKFRSGDLKVSELLGELEHRVPTLLFLGMPAFALILKLVFLRTGRYYLEHLIFSLHLHTWLFIAAMVATGYVGLAELAGPVAASVATWAITGWMLWYVVSSFRAVYRQSWTGATLTAGFVTGVYTAALFFLAAVLFAATLIWIALE